MKSFEWETPVVKENEFSEKKKKKTRLHVRVPKGEQDLENFIKILCDGTDSHYDIESFYAESIVNARSILGLIYAVSSFPEGCYLVNTEHDGQFPQDIYQYEIKAN